MQSEKNEHEQAELAQQAEAELSDTWRELLGLSTEAAANADAGAGTATRQAVEPGPALAVGAETPEIPTLNNDPWVALQRGQGIEIVDLQQVHSQALNDLDMEQALQFMQEQSASGGQEK